MKYLLLTGLCVLAACSDPTPEIITSTKHLVVMPDSSMFECPLISTFPNTKTLTDIQVAGLVKELYRNNKQCYTNINAVKEFLEHAKKTADTTENTTK
jgi:hypothetical protein